MRERVGQGGVELGVTDFGPIAKAEIDLRPLTVFIGPSNTGKSYLAILIYALQSLFATGDYWPRRRSVRSDDRLGPYPYPGIVGRRGSRELPEEAIDALVGWAREVLGDTGSDGRRSRRGHPLPREIAALVRPVLRDVAGAGEGFREEIERCFGLDGARLVRRSSRKAARISLGRHSADAKMGDLPFGYDFSFKGRSHEFTASIPDGLPLRLKRDMWFRGRPGRSFLKRLEGSADARHRRRWANEFLGRLAASMVLDIAGELARPTFYLPASRTVVMQSHQALVGALVKSASKAGLRRARRVPLLSGVLIDFLTEMVEMGDEPPLRAGRGGALADEIERRLLGGSVQVRPSETGYPSFSYRPDGWKKNLPLMSTSSMVSELAPVVLYVRHLANRGDTLIIEEPESHLHPAMQAVLARHLAILARSGIHVLVTTHSEWLLDQFANLVRMSGLEKSRREGLPGAKAALEPKRFGAWLFKPKKRPKGSVVEEIEIDPDAGGLLSDYGDTADELYGTWAEIGNRIADGADAGGP